MRPDEKKIACEILNLIQISGMEYGTWKMELIIIFV
jgi:hypothetical protein